MVAAGHPAGTASGPRPSALNGYQISTDITAKIEPVYQLDARGRGSAWSQTSSGPSSIAGVLDLHQHTQYHDPARGRQAKAEAADTTTADSAF
jgi:hypothetical protein